MKFLHLTYHFQYNDTIEEILDKHEIQNYVRYSMIEAKDNQGKHFGNQVHPGNSTVIEAQVPDDSVDELLQELKEFRQASEAHQHLEALILPIERRL